MRILSLTLLSLLSSLIALSAAEKPNIIFFLVDDYDKPETSPYGGKALTPNLDRLAAEGMLFNNAYVTSTVCTPSRYTMLTGRYAGSSTAKEFLTLFPKGRQSMPGFNVGLEHDNMNVVCIGGRIIGIELAKVVLEAFLGANFIPEPRFQRRLDKLMKVEETGPP